MHRYALTCPPFGAPFLRSARLGALHRAPLLPRLLRAVAVQAGVIAACLAFLILGAVLDA